MRVSQVVLEYRQTCIYCTLDVKVKVLDTVDVITVIEFAKLIKYYTPCR